MDKNKIKKLTQEIREDIRKVGFEDISILESRIPTATQGIYQEIYKDEPIEKTAKELFAELDYELTYEDDFEINYVDGDKFVTFAKHNKFYTAYKSGKDLCIAASVLQLRMDIKLHKAIHQQMKELGGL